MGPNWQANDAINFKLNPMWRYALDCYQNTDTQQALLTSQDNLGLNVNALLWFGYLAQQHLSATAHGKADLEQWHLRHTAPIRSLRRRLKQVKHLGLYPYILNLELLSEFLEQCQLVQSHHYKHGTDNKKMCFQASLMAWDYKVGREELQTLLKGLQLDSD